jgi:hypothetical protein
VNFTCEKKKIYNTIGLDFVIDQVLNAKKDLQEKEISPICYYVSFMETWKSMIDYECMEIFFAFIEIEKVPKMHLSDSNGQGMVDCMHNVVLATIKHVQKAIFFILIMMKSQLLITKTRFQSMVVWLKIEGGCVYSSIYKSSLKEVN